VCFKYINIYIYKSTDGDLYFSPCPAAGSRARPDVALRTLLALDGGEDEGRGGDGRVRAGAGGRWQTPAQRCRPLLSSIEAVEFQSLILRLALFRGLWARGEGLRRLAEGMLGGEGVPNGEAGASSAHGDAEGHKVRVLPRVLCSALGPSLQEGPGGAGACPEKGSEAGEGAGEQV